MILKNGKHFLYLLEMRNFKEIKKLLIFILIFAFISSVSAQTDYNESGFFEGNYDSDTIGFFNVALNPTVVSLNSQQQSLTNAKQPALVSNLDNAGLKEIIVLDSNAIKIMNRTSVSINIIESITIGSSGDFFSNMIAFDIDEDGFSEIIIVNTVTQFIHILEFNGTDFFSQIILNLSALSEFSASSDAMIKCGRANECLLAYTRSVDIPITSATRTVNAAFFNSTFVGNQLQVQTTTGQRGWCFPKIKQIQFVDYDETGDNTIEYTFSALEVDGNFNADEELHVFRVDILNDNTLAEENEVTITDIGHVTGNLQSDCRSELVGSFFTSPLVQESGDGAEPETWIASMKDTDEYAIYMIDGASTNFDKRFPDIADADGTLLSNIFAADAFADSDTGTEFCVLGQEDTQNRLDVLCASDTDRFGIGLNDELQFFLDDYTDVFGFNISNGVNDWFILTHAVDMSRDDSSNTDEVLTSFGVFDLDNTGAACSLIGSCTLSLLFNNPEVDGASIPVDYEDIGRVDIIHTTNTVIHYLDDLFINSQVAEFCGEVGSIDGQCSQYTINPCLDSTWKINTSLTVTITPFDADADQVSARVILYQGDDNEQDTGFTSNASSGFTRSFSTPVSFRINKTIADGNLQMQIRDVENEGIRTLDLPFSVSTSGLIFGDCVTTATTGVIGVEEIEIVVNATLTTDATVNSITTSITDIGGLVGLAGTTVWLILMVAFTLGIWFRASEMNMGGNFAVGTIAIFNALMVLLAARLGIFSTGLVVIIVVLAVVIIGVFAGRFFTGLTARSE